MEIHLGAERKMVMPEPLEREREIRKAVTSRHVVHLKKKKKHMKLRLLLAIVLLVIGYVQTARGSDRLGRHT
jgi:hypothetical protein